MDSKYNEKIWDHYNSIWKNSSSVHRWDKGPLWELPQGFEVLRFEPTKLRNMWTYATCGMSLFSDSNPLELHVFAPQKSDELIELLTVVAHYHRTGSSLGLGHTINFGRPWLPNSSCEYGLVSLPYLDGPTLERLDYSGIEVQFLWLLPITKQEVEFKKKYGLEALEQKFDESAFNYLDPQRKSVVL